MVLPRRKKKKEKPWNNQDVIPGNELIVAFLNSKEIFFKGFILMDVPVLAD